MVTNQLEVMQKPGEHGYAQGIVVRGTLLSLLDSPHFSKSKRYPALLEYVVRNTMAGNLSALKERVIGSEVFGRSPDYDTNDDPVVRLAAGEVRKRLAMYFSEHPDNPVIIHLPLGCYIAEFQFQERSLDRCMVDIGGGDSHSALEEGSLAPMLFSVKSPVENRSPIIRYRGASLAGVVLAMLLVSLGTWRYIQASRERAFWWPVLQSNTPALILVSPSSSRSAADGTGEDAGTNTVSENDLRLDHQLTMANAVATANICGVFHDKGRACMIDLAQNVTFADVRGKTLVLIGSFENPWTRRLTVPLRYHFVPDSPYVSNDVRYIADSNGTEKTPPWSFDFGVAPEKAVRDYSLIARFHSDVTDSLVVVAAGISGMGTRSAGGFISSPDRMKEVLARAPRNWAGMNFEAVIQTDIIQGRIGHVTIVATNFW